ncbi:PTS sugar transporter subunit IIC [Buttiauxella sp. W03-F01]|uniref:PTS mannose/fructose/sorbose/N-acetylgalactosamine transporter subunit IIC n=1 Tax=Buttiauxella sp. W03-F01 TaxID=2904524 RepID=UPI001E4B3005|nr:PTS sugar transporter subunit IIC [Buttiauxella sp. W03-F01]
MNALMVGLALAIAKYFQWWGALGTERPLICVPIVGMLLGHPVEGIIMGGALELIFLGSIQMGGTIPQEYTFGAVFGAAFAIILNKPVAVAITLAVPLSMLGVFFYNLMKIYFTALVTRFDGYLEKGDDRGFMRLWRLFGVVYISYYFAAGFLGIWLGTEFIEKLVESVPPVIMKSLNVAAGMLPAIGFAMLMKMLWERNIALFFFVGFGMAVFLKLPIIGVAFFATCVAVWIALTEYNQKQRNAAPTKARSSGNIDEDFF